MDRLDREEYGISEVQEAVMARSIANGNALAVLIYRLASKGSLDKADLKLISDAFSKPLDLNGPRENRFNRQAQDQFDAFMAQAVAALIPGVDRM